MQYSEIIAKVSEDLNLPEDVVDRTYKAFWYFIKDTIQKLPLKKELDKNSFDELRTSFNIPSLGKLSCTYDRMQRIKKRFEYIRNLKKNTE